MLPTDCYPLSLSPLGPGLDHGLPPSHYHDAILVIVDRLTKAAHFIPTTKSMAAPDVASLFLQHVVRAHGLPDTLVSDRDPVFTSHFLATAAGAVWNSGQPLYYFPSPNGRADGAVKFCAGAVLAHLYRLPTVRLGQPPPSGRIFLQQFAPFCHNNFPVFC